MKNLILAMFALLLIAGIATATTYYRQRNLIIAVPVAPEYYYSVGDDDDKADRIAEKVMRRFAETFPAKKTLDRNQFKVIGKEGGIDDVVLEILDTNCIQCHKPGAKKPGIQLFTNNRKLFVDSDNAKERRRREAVYEAIVSGEMPKNGGPLSPAQKAIIKEWSEK